MEPEKTTMPSRINYGSALTCFIQTAGIARKVAIVLSILTTAQKSFNAQKKRCWLLRTGYIDPLTHWILYDFLLSFTKKQHLSLLISNLSKHQTFAEPAASERPILPELCFEDDLPRKENLRLELFMNRRDLYKWMGKLRISLILRLL